MKKIIFDTDIGSDIDDAICLAYLLQQPECELIGITTVSGEAEERAKIASALCIAGGQPKIPIYPGSELPIGTPQKQPTASQAKMVSRWKHQTQFPSGQAVEFLRQMIRKNPHEITLLATGPMTNLGLLFRIDPEVVYLLKEIVVMCGVFAYKTPAYVALTEWNAFCDPIGAAILYEQAVPITSIGLDVTSQLILTKEEVLLNFQAEIMQPVLDFAQDWFIEQQQITFHDPLAAAVLFQPDICKYEQGNVSVETNSSRVRGLTYWLPEKNGFHRTAFSVNRDKFFAHYFDIVNGKR